MCAYTHYISPPTGGVPHDGTPIKQTVVLAVPLTVVMYLLAQLELCSPSSASDSQSTLGNQSKLIITSIIFC